MKKQENYRKIICDLYSHIYVNFKEKVKTEISESEISMFTYSLALLDEVLSLIDAEVFNSKNNSILNRIFRIYNDKDKLDIEDINIKLSSIGVEKGFEISAERL